LEFELATSNAKRFTIKRTASPCDAVRQFESGYLVVASCTSLATIFLPRIKNRLALVPLLLLSKSKHARSLRASSPTSALRCAGF
jgi:hypothetical protein